ncbi:Uncharacterised protein [Mycobacteroides abscessus subsp. abscessus]|nr:Uncharacterised protein [Mycobacteroides abscessus subsp. abscessus]
MLSGRRVPAAPRGRIVVGQVSGWGSSMFSVIGEWDNSACLPRLRSGSGLYAKLLWVSWRAASRNPPDETDAILSGSVVIGVDRHAPDFLVSRLQYESERGVIPDRRGVAW